MESFDTITRIAVLAIPVVLGITLHEVAHGWVADRLGDPTAREAGRLSLNPLRHVDPVGTVLVPIALALVSGFVLGWARPVPVNAARLGQPRRDMALVALAGPGANLAQAFVWALVVKVAVDYHEPLGGAAVLLLFAGVAGIFVNTVLGVLNLIPLPPLDGGRVVAALLAPGAARVLARVEPWGIPVLLVLLVSGVLGRVIAPVIQFVGTGIGASAGVPDGVIWAVLDAIMGGT